MYRCESEYNNCEYNRVKNKCTLTSWISIVNYIVIVNQLYCLLNNNGEYSIVICKLLIDYMETGDNVEFRLVMIKIVFVVE